MLILLLFLPTTFGGVCYQCASELALINWSRYGLPYASCTMWCSLYDYKHNRHWRKVRWKSYREFPLKSLKEKESTYARSCMRPSLRKHTRRDFTVRIPGVVRDCQTYFRSPKSLPEGTTQLCRHSERTTLRNQRINMTFCYCQGSLCNGKGSTHLRRAPHRRQPSRRDPSLASQSYSIEFLLAFIVWALS
ncbi:hypothetical protein RB195_013946 [Necator americanus]|uniref:Protein quiver n=1 Tax=Necator americanus TaxID=51031 RepID=A0ABR1DXW3_NECAM